MNKIYVVVASGQSLTQEQVDYIKSKRASGLIQGIIAVSNVGLDFLPDANALVSHDSIWWLTHRAAQNFKGDKYSNMGLHRTKPFKSKDIGFNSGLNSGLMAMFVARDIYKADKIILLGFDMHGTHYFGKHTSTYNGKALINTDEKKFNIHLKQFEKFTGCEVYNATPDTRLNQFPKVNLYDII